MTHLILLGATAFLIFLIAYCAATGERSRRLMGLGAALSIFLACVASLYPLDKSIRLGLDLSGGTAFTLELAGEPSEGAVKQAVEVIRKRIDFGGVREPVIQPVGDNRVLVQIPGLNQVEKEESRIKLQRVAKLEFRLVHPESSDLIRSIDEGKESVPATYEIMEVKEEKPEPGKKIDEKKKKERMVVSRRVEMTGKQIAKAFRFVEQNGTSGVSMRFNTEGAELFGKLTEANVGRSMAIVLDGELCSAPVIRAAIWGGDAQITGTFTPQEAEELASVLENPLENPVQIIEERSVEPTLGQDSIDSGAKAGIAAFVLVVLYMVIYYRLAGAVSIVALVLNLIILLGLLAQFHFTLTMPGIAGIVLTIGMAVDANVLIYERIRDELAAGKTISASISAGFERAFSAIVDSNITTLIPAVVLSFLGTGPLQGFAVTLTLGIIANLFTALVVSRNCFDWMLHFNMIQKLSFLQFLSNPTYDFLKGRTVAMVFSVLILAAGLFSANMKGERVLGVDFMGGDSVTMTYKQAVPVSELRAALDAAGLKDTTIQYSTGDDKLSMEVKVSEGEKAVAALKAKYPQAEFNQVSLDRVGPKVGQELLDRALVALGLGLLGILIYSALRFEWTYALAAAIGQLHDVLIAVGLILFFGGELTLPLVAAFLTIAGYSINDKIVVFDRIREGAQNREQGTLYEIINRAMNLTLARTLLTGGSTLLAIIALMFLGGAVIHDFAVAMFFGVVSGIYSSHFISPPLALWFESLRSNKHGHTPRKLAAA